MYLQKTGFFDDFFAEKVIYIFLRNLTAVKNEWKQSVFFSFSFRGNISLLKFFVKEIKENSLSNPKRFTERKRCSNFYEIRYGALVLH